MRSKPRLKLTIFVVALAVGIPMAAISLALLAQFVSYFQQGADPASIFRGHTLFMPEADQAAWASVDDGEGAALKLSDEEEIIAAYWLAWEALIRAHQTDDTSDLATYWAGAAFEHARAGVGSGQSELVAHAGHRLHLTYFSDDGSVAAFTDELFALTHRIHGQEAVLYASAAVVMTLDQGFWRIRQMTLSFDA